MAQINTPQVHAAARLIAAAAAAAAQRGIKCEAVLISAYHDMFTKARNRRSQLFNVISLGFAFHYKHH